MLVFTYCSSRSSRYGYQYSYFSSDSTKAVCSFLSSEMSGQTAISKEFIKWCENYNGWQLALRKSKQKDEYLLMVGQLEKSRELEKKIQMKRGNTDLDLNSLDSDYYISLGFLGSSNEIKRITVFMLREYKNDGFRALFNLLEKSIRKIEDATRYEIDTKQFNSIFNNVPAVGPSVTATTNSSFNHPLGRLVRKVVPFGTYLSLVKAKIHEETLSTRKKRVEKCIDILSNFDNLSGNVPLLIAYDYFKIDAIIDIRIDYEYLWYY